MSDLSTTLELDYGWVECEWVDDKYLVILTEHDEIKLNHEDSIKLCRFLELWTL